MTKCWVLMFLVLALVLVLHATARNMPDTEKKDTVDVANSNNNHEQANVNVVNVPKAMGANGKAVKDKKCGVVFGGLGGAAGVGGVAGVIPLGGIGGIGGLGGAGGVGGAAGKGGGIGIIP